MVAPSGPYVGVTVRAGLRSRKMIEGRPTRPRLFFFACCYKKEGDNHVIVSFSFSWYWHRQQVQVERRQVKDLPRLDMILGMMSSYRKVYIVCCYYSFSCRKVSIGKKRV